MIIEKMEPDRRPKAIGQIVAEAILVAMALMAMVGLGLVWFYGR